MLIGIGAGAARSQGAVQDVIDRQCSAVNLASEREAIYAAGVGAMTQDAGLQRALLGGLSQPGGGLACAGSVAASTCSASYIEFATSVLTNMTTGAGGSVFFGALDAGTVAEDPARETMGAAGALLGGLAGALTGEDTFGGAAKGAVIGGGIGLGIGLAADRGEALRQCRALQATFDALTAELLRRGLRPSDDPARLRRQIEDIASRMGADQRDVATRMLAAMGVAEARIDVMR
jgi:hypothetical protein